MRRPRLHWNNERKFEDKRLENNKRFQQNENDLQNETQAQLLLLDTSIGRKHQLTY